MERQGAAGHFKVHSLIDKVYSRTNLRLAWQKVRANRGAGGVDAVSLDDFAERAEEELERLHCELRDGDYRPKLFNRLNRWIVRRIWSHQCRRWRNIGWRRYPEQFLYGECRLVNLLTLIPDLK